MTTQIHTHTHMYVISGQIIATSHDRFPPNHGLVREIPLFQGNLGWARYIHIIHIVAGGGGKIGRQRDHIALLPKGMDKFVL